MFQIALVVAQGLMLLAYAITFIAMPGIVIVAIVFYIYRRRYPGLGRSPNGE